MRKCFERPGRQLAAGRRSAVGGRGSGVGGRRERPTRAQLTKAGSCRAPSADKRLSGAESKMLAPERLVVKNPRNGATYVARRGNSSYPRCASRPRDVAQPAHFHPFPAASAAAMPTYVPDVHSPQRGLATCARSPQARQCPVRSRTAIHRPPERAPRSTRPPEQEARSTRTPRPPHRRYRPGIAPNSSVDPNPSSAPASAVREARASAATAAATAGATSRLNTDGMM